MILPQQDTTACQAQTVSEAPVQPLQFETSLEQCILGLSYSSKCFELIGHSNKVFLTQLTQLVLCRSLWRTETVVTTVAH